MDDSTATIPQSETIKPEEPAPKTGAVSSIELEPEVTYKGNQTDILALVTLVGTIFMGATCGTCGWGFYCMPLIAVILGIIGVATAKKSTNPGRTKTYSWIGIGVGGFFTLVVAAFMLFYVLYFALIIILAATSSDGSFSSNMGFW